MLIAGGVASTHHVQDVALHLFRTTSGYVTFALLGDYIGDITLFRAEVVAHGLRLVLLLALLEERVTELLSDGIQSELRIDNATVHVHLNQLRLQFDILVFHVAFTKQIGPVACGHDDRVGRLIGDRRIQPILFGNGVSGQCRTIRWNYQKTILRNV